MENQDKNIPEIVKNSILVLETWCNLHPTCKNCGFKKEHVGCQFRGKSPKEFNKIKIN